MPTSPAARLATTKQNFHIMVKKLYCKTQEPTRPINYRGGTFPQSKEYTLLHEEEQHLADHIAVLAHTKDDAHYISAATLQECQGSCRSSLNIRIASNKTPSGSTVDGLQKCLAIVERFAREENDEKIEIYRSNLLSEIINLNKDRLRGRIIGQKKRFGKAGLSCERVEKLCCMLLVHDTNIDTSHWRDSLCGHLSNFINTLAAFSDSNEVEHLTEIVLASHKVSTIADTPSLEQQLRAKSIDLDLSHLRTVLEIDKISRYLDIRNDLLHYSRKPRCRNFFRNIHFEVCTAPGDQHVHGEIQLIFFYERYPAALPPRCIGSSKSACFLCDLFIKKHGVYRISHSHARLYRKWMIPEGEWIDDERISRFDSILRGMSEDMMRIKETFVRPPGYEGNGTESRVHLLALPESARSSNMSLSTICESQKQLLLIDNSAPRETERQKDLEAISWEEVSPRHPLGVRSRDSLAGTSEANSSRRKQASIIDPQL